MAERIFGLETEYGCLVDEPLTAAQVIPEIRNWFFEQGRYGMIDVHDREWDEPAGNGGFLYNGGRMYVDMGHLEYCSPECRRLKDIIRYDRAGDLLLMQAIRDLGIDDRVQFFRNNVDPYTAATFGCHENYSIRRHAPFTDANIMALLTFQTLRVLFTGAGKVASDALLNYHGPHLLKDYSPAPYQISQRADYIQNEFFEWVQHNRAIINTRDEPLADPSRFRRLHLLHGDTNVLPATTYLKFGTSSLVLDLLEDNALPRIELVNAVHALKTLSSHPEGPWVVKVLGETGTRTRMDALEILDTFRQAAAVEYAGRDSETDEVLDLWDRVIRGLSGKRDSMIGILDWVTKQYLLESFMEEEGLDWEDPWLKSLDMEYHHVDPARSLGLSIAVESTPWAVEAPDAAMVEAPADTRARVRGGLMQRIRKKGSLYYLDWDRVEVPDQWRHRMDDPFNPRLPDEAELME